jgi:GrpB-like predicted nucleotidyltransferase (UPF0157 family)
MTAERKDKVELRPHDPSWRTVAMAEARRLAPALGGNLLEVHHIGSTAIPAIKAKPIIDLMPEVRSLAALDASSLAVRDMGYQWHGEHGIPGRRFCTREDPEADRRFHVHIFESGSPEIARHLAFRDYLLAHPLEARAYEAQKERALAQHPDDRAAYQEAKSDWIKTCQIRASAWWRSKSL